MNDLLITLYFKFFLMWTRTQPHPNEAECQGNFGLKCHTNHLLRLLVVALFMYNNYSLHTAVCGWT